MCDQIDNAVENEYAAGLAEQKSETNSINARDNMLHFYRDNKDICDKAYQYYNQYEEDRFRFVNEPVRLSKNDFLKQLNPKKILILTANPIERGVLLRWLSEKKGSPLKTYIVGNYSYNVYDVLDDNTTESNIVSFIHVSPGKTGADPTRRVINKTCELFQPDYIISLGICYGFDKKKYSIGYVFLSAAVMAVRVNFRDPDGNADELEAETEIVKQPANRLIESINQRLMYAMTQNILSEKKHPILARNQVGRFLSINGLMSNADAKQSLLEQCGKAKPIPLGGEMEAAGILESDIVFESDFSNWLIVKSICDWGEMKNSLSEDENENKRIKDTLQAYAMTNTCGVFNIIWKDLCGV